MIWTGQNNINYWGVCRRVVNLTLPAAASLAAGNAAADDLDLSDQNNGSTDRPARGTAEQLVQAHRVTKLSVNGAG